MYIYGILRSLYFDSEENIEQAIATLVTIVSFVGLHAIGSGVSSLVSVKHYSVANSKVYMDEINSNN